MYIFKPSYERFECLKEGLKAKSLRKQAEQRQKLLQGLLTTNPKFSLPIIDHEVDAEKWHVYFQGRSYERFLCLKKELNSK